MSGRDDDSGEETWRGEVHDYQGKEVNIDTGEVVPNKIAGSRCS